jgi:hypothetical protein
VITDRGEIWPDAASYAIARATREFKARATEWRLKREALPTMMIEEAPVISWEMRPNGAVVVRHSLGAEIVFYANGQFVVLCDPTFRIESDNGAGARENTASLRGYYKFTPRPATETRSFDRARAPTELHG